MALHFLQGSKELMTNTNLSLMLRSKLKHRETKYTWVRSWDTKIDAPDPIHTAFTPRCALSLHKEHTLKVGWQRLWKCMDEADWRRVERICRKGEALQSRWCHQAKISLTGSMSAFSWSCWRRGGHPPGWCSVAQRLYIYNTFYILRHLRS